MTFLLSYRSYFLGYLWRFPMRLCLETELRIWAVCPTGEVRHKFSQGSATFSGSGTWVLGIPSLKGLNLGPTVIPNWAGMERMEMVKPDVNELLRIPGPSEASRCTAAVRPKRDHLRYVGHVIAQFSGPETGGITGSRNKKHGRDRTKQDAPKKAQQNKTMFLIPVWWIELWFLEASAMTDGSQRPGLILMVSQVFWGRNHGSLLRQVRGLPGLPHSSLLSRHGSYWE